LADNFTVLDSDGEEITFRATNTSGVYTPWKNSQVLVSNDYVTNTNPLPVSINFANAVISNTNNIPSGMVIANTGVSNSNPVPVTAGYHSWTTSWGVSGVPVTNADCHTTACTVTDATSNSTTSLVIDDLFVSVDVPTTVTFYCETSAAVVIGPFYMSGNTSQHLSPRNSKGWRLATANKKLQVKTGVAANVMVMAGYHSEL